jgi:DedD protein
MTSALQNRLVGTIIVVALVVILVPEFLDGEKRTNQQSFVDVPPVLEVVDVEEAKEVDLSGVEQAVNQPIELVDEQAIDDVPVTDNTTINSQNSSEEVISTNTEANPNSLLSNAATNDVQDTDSSQGSTDVTNDDEGTASQTVTTSKNKTTKAGWVVQLGSFRHEKNVQALLKTLNDAGYRAYSTPVMTSAGKLNKVFVGPELDKNVLEQALPRLQEITQLKGKITAFEVSAD